MEAGQQPESFDQEIGPATTNPRGKSVHGFAREVRSDYLQPHVVYLFVVMKDEKVHEAAFISVEDGRAQAALAAHDSFVNSPTDLSRRLLVALQPEEPEVAGGGKGSKRGPGPAEGERLLKALESKVAPALHNADGGFDGLGVNGRE